MAACVFRRWEKTLRSRSQVCELSVAWPQRDEECETLVEKRSSSEEFMSVFFEDLYGAGGKLGH